MRYICDDGLILQRQLLSERPNLSLKEKTQTDLIQSNRGGTQIPAFRDVPPLRRKNREYTTLGRKARKT